MSGTNAAVQARPKLSGASLQVELVGQTVDDLEARLYRVHRASLKYRDALQTLCATQSEFGTALLECRCPGSDDNAIKGVSSPVSAFCFELSQLSIG